VYYEEHLAKYIMTTTTGFYIASSLSGPWASVVEESDFFDGTFNRPVYANRMYAFTSNFGEDDGGDESSWAYIYISTDQGLTYVIYRLYWRFYCNLVIFNRISNTISKYSNPANTK
jgi:hypothetical protein